MFLCFLLVGCKPSLPQETPTLVFHTATSQDTGDDLENWELVWGGTDYDEGHSVYLLDQGYLILSTTTSRGQGKSDVSLLKIGKSGTQEWETLIGGIGWETAAGLQITQTGFMVFGTTNSQGTGSDDAWVVNLNPQGKVLWEKTYGGKGTDRVLSMTPTADKGYILAGSTLSQNAKKEEAWIVRLDQDGNLLWEKSYGGNGEDIAYSIIQSRDHNFVFVGTTESNSQGRSDAWMVKLDSQGHLLWEKFFGGAARERAEHLIETHDGQIVFTGYTGSSGQGTNDLWVVKVDADGNKLWDPTFGGTERDEGHFILETHTQELLVLGHTYSKGNGKNDVWVIKLDALGNMIWETTLGGDSWDNAFQMQETPDGRIVVAGVTSSKSEGKSGVWVFQLNAKGQFLLSEDSLRKKPL
ncbi:hypothetical protein WDW89_09290 [Deltaproteobacteria bacterium TL4]